MTHFDLIRRSFIKLSAALFALLFGAVTPAFAANESAVDIQSRHSVVVTRLVDGTIIGPETDPSIGNNIQGPSMIRVPDWVENPLGKYYLYFADHKGQYIR
ncbi:MAG TPA: hypothetical protein DIT42_05365, partial [Gammaproteobacteria bacterium]|nr:hypothetical protein [Gammaproteobacteria bacterium]